MYVRGVLLCIKMYTISVTGGVCGGGGGGREDTASPLADMCQDIFKSCKLQYKNILHKNHSNNSFILIVLICIFQRKIYCVIMYAKLFFACGTADSV